MNSENEKRVFLVRHLPTEYNKSGQIMGGIVDLGIVREAKIVSAFFQRLDFIKERFKIDPAQTVIISSPLGRCVQTAELLRERLEIDSPIIVNSDIIETDMGDFAGKKAGDLRAEYGNLVDIWMYEPENFTFPGGESYKDVAERAYRARELVSYLLTEKKTVIVCSHVDIIKMMICQVEGKSFNTRRTFSVPNGSVSILTVDKEGRLVVEGVDVSP